MGCSVLKRCRKTNSAAVPTERRVRANDAVYNASFKYANNYISTSRYNLLTFLPKNLFEQFQRLANAYFLFLIILQLIPQITSLSPVTTILPLVVVLAVSAIKDAADDIQRHRSDRQVNNRKSLVLRDGKLIEEKWQKVVVGDIIKMEKDQFVAADLLLLSTSEPNGLCYIETAELDGETNLKVRQALTATASMLDDIQQFAAFEAEVTCETPNNVLSKFEGVLRLGYHEDIPAVTTGNAAAAAGSGDARAVPGGGIYALNNDRVLLRGCVLRNTKWCFGLVLFAGPETKLMMNSGRATFKRTNIDRLMNELIVGIFVFLLAMCIACCIGSGVWESIVGYNFAIYLPWESHVPPSKDSGAAVIASLQFLSYVILLNTVVPISLYVSVEMIRFGHSYWINWDSKLYYAKKDQPARSRTTTLNEELGQIEYIFSDKTGTLTQNIMTFNKCSIDGQMYGDAHDSFGRPIDVTSNTPKVDFSKNPYYEPTFDFYDGNLLQSVQDQNQSTCCFFKLLAICHTVMASCNEEGKLEYQAQSPDEAALVSAARNFGFVFKSRTSDSITIEALGKEETYELLGILDFDNVRKRMSVIVRQEDKITLYCKGADSTIYDRLDSKCDQLKVTTTAHLESFALDGLRTLCCAVKEIIPEYYSEWKERHLAASVALRNRDELLAAVYDEIEQDLELIGATAIEDKLQDGVPDTIANLLLAGIKIWVLTGDKQETAVNIGYSCQLLTDSLTDIHVIDADSFEEVENQLRQAWDKMESTPDGATTTPNNQLSATTDVDQNETANGTAGYSNTAFGRRSHHRNTGGYAIIINGHSLEHALRPELEMLLLKTGCRCRAVICCRVTPLQKALVVQLVKRNLKSITLAIGDGANDVSMIKTAHIGVGISGQEGMQAVLASDYSLAQFAFLERLLLVHGRWSYIRMCKFLKYFFYKNFAFTLCQFWFAFFCGFSAQSLYDQSFVGVYNIVYTSLPVMALGFLDQDVSDVYSIKYPKLYAPGHSDLFFNKKVFAKSAIEGIVSSLVLFFIPYGSYVRAIQPNGTDANGLQAFGTAVASILIVVVSLRCGLETSYWTAINHVFIWGSILTYFALTALLYSPLIHYSYEGVAINVWNTADFWFTMMLCSAILLLPVVALRFYCIDMRPTLTDKVRLRQRVAKLRTRAGERVLRQASSIQRTPSRRSVGRSGYAFAHQRGFGDLITSGSMMRAGTGATTVTGGSVQQPSAAAATPMTAAQFAAADNGRVVGADISIRTHL